MTLMLFEPLNRGEIILSHERLLELNAQLEQFHFRFQVLDHSQPSKKPPKLDPVLEPKTKRAASFSAKSDWSDVVYGDGDEIIFNKRPTRVRKQPLAFVEEFYDEVTVAPTKRSERHHHDHQHQQQHQHHQQHDHHNHHHHHHHKMGKSSTPSLYKTVSNILKTLPKLQKDTWEYTCYRILQVVKYMDTDKWFWYPVDPVADGVPNYLKVIKQPMDFQTVIERLHKGHYSNPFQWQTDMRQIFYNAFTFYKSDNIIWQAALRVCTQFEAKLATTRFVNCDEFTELLTLSPETAKTALLNYNEETFARKGVPSRKGRDALDDVVEVLGKRRGGRKSYEFDYGAAGDGIADGGDDQGSEYDDASYMGSSDDQHSPDEYISMDLYNGRNKRMGNRRMGGSKQGYYLAAGPIPAVGHVPPPPPFQTVGINDKSLSSAQQRTLDYNLTRLAPNQRKAALELVEDDLGILAELFKDDQTFTFDACLLPIEKQRRIFLYVNQMARRNEGIMHAQAVSGTMTKRSGVKRRFAASGRGVATGAEDEDGDGDDEDEDDADDDDIDAEVDLDDADYDEDDLIVDGHHKRDGRRLLPVQVQAQMDHRRRKQGKGKGKGKGYGPVFDDDSSSSLSDVASNFLSSDEFFSSSEDEAKRPNEKPPKGANANVNSVENDAMANGTVDGVAATNTSATDSVAAEAQAQAPTTTTNSAADLTNTLEKTTAVEAFVDVATTSLPLQSFSKEPADDFPPSNLAKSQGFKAATPAKTAVGSNKGKRGKKGKSAANLPEYRPVDDDEEVTLASSLSRRLVASSVEFLDKEKAEVDMFEQDDDAKQMQVTPDVTSPHPKRRAVERKASTTTTARAGADADVDEDVEGHEANESVESQETSPRVTRGVKDVDLTRVKLAAGDGAAGTARRASVDKELDADADVDVNANASASGNENVNVKPGVSDGKDESKSSAWMEWKGQVIHHGIVAQQNGVAPRNDDEKIAEGYDARI